MKTSLPIMLSLLFCGLFSFNSKAQIDLPQSSQLASVSQRIGITDITVTYSRPAVNGREIWGKLVPHGMNNLGFGTAKESPWRAGANENTTITFTHDVKIENKAVKAGTYGLHMVIHEDGNVIVILSTNSTSWGSYFYDPAEDLLQVTVKSENGEHRELLTYEFNTVKPNSTILSLHWGEKIIPVEFQVPVVDIVTEDIKAKMKDSPGFNRQTWEQGASYLLANDGDLELALSWINAAIEGQFFSQKTFNNLSIKSQIHLKKGEPLSAMKAMDEAMPFGTALEVHGYGRQLIAMGMADKALEVFKFNAEKNDHSWPTNYGLARAYSAKGDFEKALKYLNKALENAPAQSNKDRVMANIEKLKAGKDIN